MSEDQKNIIVVKEARIIANLLTQFSDLEKRTTHAADEERLRATMVCFREIYSEFDKAWRRIGLSNTPKICGFEFVEQNPSPTLIALPFGAQQSQIPLEEIERNLLANGFVMPPGHSVVGNIMAKD